MDLDTCMKDCEDADYVLNQTAWGALPRSLEIVLSELYLLMLIVLIGIDKNK